MRSDAQDNRDRILGAARAAFAEEGLGVTMREIARRAQVGPATLYRRFPTKEALVVEVFGEQMAACQAVVDEGMADPDPWRGFCAVIEKVCTMHALDRGFTAAFVSEFGDSVGLGRQRERALRSFAELARRAKTSGQLRPDFVIDDLVLVLMANGGIRTRTPAAAVAASRRFAALLVQAFHTRSGTARLPPAARLDLLPV